MTETVVTVQPIVSTVTTGAGQSIVAAQTSTQTVTTPDGGVVVTNTTVLNTIETIKAQVISVISQAVNIVTAGIQGPGGAKGDIGNPGQGVPAGGGAGQILEKIDSTDYNTRWADKSAPDLISYTYFGGM